MRKYILPFVVLGFGIPVYIIAQLVVKEINHSDYPVESCSVIDVQSTEVRKSIAFILGEDKETDNTYYQEATHYYRYNPRGKTNYVITHCRSLQEVRLYLIENKPVNHHPWGLINLVSHGNHLLGLSVKITTDSKRTTNKHLQNYLDTTQFMAMPDDIIDASTVISIHGCGVGNNLELLQLLSEYFSSEHHIPQVNSSKLFEYYASINQGGTISESEHYYSKVWYVQYKMGYKPEDFALTNMFRQKYPQNPVNWNDALQREQPRWIGDSYSYSFQVPVKWVYRFENADSVASLKTNRDKENWIHTQPHIVTDLQQLKIPVENFNWWFRKVFVKNDDRSTSQAIWIKGYCTVHCVLQPLTDKTANHGLLPKPFIPGKTNSEFFGYVNGCNKMEI